MPYDRASLAALKTLLNEVDLVLETTPELPENRTGRSRELLQAAIALTDDLLKQSRSRTNAAAILGRKGGSTTARKLGTDHYRKMAAARKRHGGGRPRKQAD